MQKRTKMQKKNKKYMFIKDSKMFKINKLICIRNILKLVGNSNLYKPVYAIIPMQIFSLRDCICLQKWRMSR